MSSPLPVWMHAVRSTFGRSARTAAWCFRTRITSLSPQWFEEDIAFGLENYDTPVDEIPEKVARALAIVGMSGSEKKSPHMLSGGQKTADCDCRRAGNRAGYYYFRRSDCHVGPRRPAGGVVDDPEAP